jgi:hypothetical protein
MWHGPHKIPGMGYHISWSMSVYISTSSFHKRERERERERERACVRLSLSCKPIYSISFFIISTSMSRSLFIEINNELIFQKLKPSGSLNLGYDLLGLTFCSLVGDYWFSATCCFIPWRWRQQVSLKRITAYQIIWVQCHKPAECNLNLHHHGNLKFHVFECTTIFSLWFITFYHDRQISSIKSIKSIILL